MHTHALWWWSIFLLLSNCYNFSLFPFTNLLWDGTVFYMQTEVIVDCSVVRTGRNLTVVAMEFKVKKTGKLAYTARSTFFNMPVAKLWSCGSTNLNLGISVWIFTLWWVCKNPIKFYIGSTYWKIDTFTI